MGATVSFEGGDAHKIAHVLRMRSGDHLEVIDSSGCAFAATLEVDAAGVRARLDAIIEEPGVPVPSITLAQGVPKGAKMDFVVEKSTELGVARIVPLLTERAVASAEHGGKVERWRRLARAAAQQSGRRSVPRVDDPVRFEDLVQQFGSFDCVLVPWELADRAPLRERLPALLANARSVLVVIGPEGGISHREAQRAKDGGAHLVSLGHRILRTETAGLIACVAIRYQTGEL